MGTVELCDQVEVLHWLADNLDYIDIDRVAIHGWSYGTWTFHHFLFIVLTFCSIFRWILKSHGLDPLLRYIQGSNCGCARD